MFIKIKNIHPQCNYYSTHNILRKSEYCLKLLPSYLPNIIIFTDVSEM